MSRLSHVPLMTIAVSAFACSLSVGNAQAACTPIANVNQLQAMRNNLADDYCLTKDIDASAKPNFAPVGNSLTPFTGTFNGAGHTISNLTIKSSLPQVGLFGYAYNAAIRNVTLANVNVRSTSVASVAAAGGIAGVALADSPNTTEIANVRVSGLVRCSNDNCDAGGLAGALDTGLLRNSSSSAAVTSSRFVGGAVGFTSGVTIRRTYTTGAVLCTGSECMAGGLVGRLQGSNINRSFATGPVQAAGGGFSRAGGLVAYSEAGFGINSAITTSFAEGPVTGGAGGYTAAFLAQHNGLGPLDQIYGIGPVSSSGATTCGLTCSVGTAGDPVSITAAYWDTDTTGQATSTAGTGMTTAQLRAALPAGFDPAVWGITPNLSYPFLLARDIDFASPLATLVRTGKVFAFLPISQYDESQFKTPPANAEPTSLATVYTMIARAIGITQNVPKLKDVAIDRYFWNEATQRTRWGGPVQTYATLGPLTPISGSTPIEVANVIGVMDGQQLVILRGTYRKGGGVRARHWMLGTLYTTDGANATAVIAHDPLTGLQVTIDPATKRVVSPANFPLATFKVDAYRAVTVN